MKNITAKDFTVGQTAWVLQEERPFSIQTYEITKVKDIQKEWDSILT